eukprot:3710990-Rhodomonas_salina.2
MSSGTASDLGASSMERTSASFPLKSLRSPSCTYPASSAGRSRLRELLRADMFPSSNSDQVSQQPNMMLTECWFTRPVLGRCLGCDFFTLEAVGERQCVLRGERAGLRIS